MAAVVDIYNRALQILGAGPVTDVDEDSTAAAACRTCYEVVRDAELQANDWVFARGRDSLAADATAPDWGRANAFTLPADFLALAPHYPEDNSNDRDWEIEGQKIYTDDSAPLYLRFIRKITDPNMMHPLFRETLSASMAEAMAEELTQSNSKKEAAKDAKKDALAKAKKANAFLKRPAQPATDSWITARA